MKKILLLILLITAINANSSPILSELGKITFNNVIESVDATRHGAVAYASDNSIYVGGNYSKIFDSSLGLEEPIAVSSYILHYSQTMQLKAAASIVGSATITSMTPDENGGLYVAGTFADEITIKSAAGTGGQSISLEGFKMNDAYVSTQSASFVAHYDSSMKLIIAQGYVPEKKNLDSSLYSPAAGDIYFRIDKIMVINGHLFASAIYAGQLEKSGLTITSGYANIFDAYYTDLSAGVILQLDNFLYISTIAYQAYSGQGVKDQEPSVYALNFTGENKIMYISAIANGAGTLSYFGNNESYDIDMPTTGGRNFGYSVSSVNLDSRVKIAEERYASSVSSEAIFNNLKYMNMYEDNIIISGVYMNNLAFDNSIKSVGNTDLFVTALSKQTLLPVWNVSSKINEGDVTKYAESFLSAAREASEISINGAVTAISNKTISSTNAGNISLSTGTGNFASQGTITPILAMVSQGDDKVVTYSTNDSETQAIFTSYSITSSVAENTISDKNITIFPNPVKDIINISQEIDAKIFTLQGILVKESKQASVIPVSELTPGIYLLKTQSQTIKFLKQ